jgi:hypothetical protein
MRSPLTLLAPLFALMLIAAACGDGDDDTAAEETTTTEAAATESSEEETTTTEAVEEETTTTAAAGGDGEGAGSAYCTASAEADRLIDDWIIGSPESTEQYFSEILELIDSVESPSEIADDFATLRQGFSDISSELEKVGWNILAIDEDNPILNDAATEAASDRIEAFDLAYCGDSDDETSSPDPGLDGDDLASLFDNPEFQQLMTDAGITLTDEQAACLAENLDDDLLASLAGLLGEDLADIDPQSVTVFLDILVTCEIPLTALANAL